MAARRGRPEPDTAEIAIRYPREGRVELVSGTLFADPGSPFFRRFVGRLFSVPEVESLVIEAKRAEIRYRPGRTSLSRLMRRIGTALASEGGRSAASAELYLGAPAGAPIRVHRYGDVLSTWEVRHTLPGRLRARHPSLRRRRGVADAVVEELVGVPGILGCRIGLYTGSLLVVHDPRRIGRDDVLALCEAALHRAEARGPASPSLTRFGVGIALLTLAVAGHLAYTPLLVLCAVLLVTVNVETFRRAVKSVRARSVDVDVTYGTLLLLTILSGDFLSIALMAWSVAAWPLLLDRRLAATRHALAGDRQRLATVVPIRRNGLALTAPVAALTAGDIAVVAAGGTLPADGVVIEGEAAVDERRITGEPGVADKTVGQPVYAGARVLTGRVVIEVTRSERDAVGTEIRRRLLESARYEPVSSTPGAALAKRAAPPALALSAVGAMTGGLGTAIAILAPNYSSAPGLSTPLDRSATLMACADAGLLVRDEAALIRLAQADAAVIHAGADEAEAAALADALRVRGIEPFVLGAATAPAPFVRRLRRKGMKVAVIGGSDDPAAAHEADVAIAVGGRRLPSVDTADVVLVSPRLARAVPLLDLARLHASETRLNRHFGVWPNVVAVGGAFVLGFASLHCTLLSNLGALIVYWRGSGRLSNAEAVWRAHRP
jgi:Cu2+-exporting ATPase